MPTNNGQRLHDFLFLIACPYCGEPFPVGGPNGFFVHVITDHPFTELWHILITTKGEYGPGHPNR